MLEEISTLPLGLWNLGGGEGQRRPTRSTVSRALSCFPPSWAPVWGATLSARPAAAQPSREPGASATRAVTPTGRGASEHILVPSELGKVLPGILLLDFPKALESEDVSLGTQKKKQGVHSSATYVQCDPESDSTSFTTFDFLNGKQEGPLLLGVWVKERNEWTMYKT